MGSLVNSVNSHWVSSAHGDSAPRCNIATAGECRADGSDNYFVHDDGAELCPARLLANSPALCHTEKELRCPTKASLMQFVLPNKIYFRYCWLFSGTPTDNGYIFTNGGDALTDRDLVERNRLMMTSELPNDVDLERRCDRRHEALRAFWLTSEGDLVYVTSSSEDMKFRSIRARNRSVALSLWTSNPELCGQTMRESASAYSNLIRICERASVSSNGRFYNLYANYPLPVQGEPDELAGCELHVCEERDVCGIEIRDGDQLLVYLSPIYEKYFDFITDQNNAVDLRDRVESLGARWLVEHDRNETLFTLRVKHNWFTRMCIRVTMLMSAM